MIFAAINRVATNIWSWTWALAFAFLAVLLMRGWLQGLPALVAYAVAFSFAAGIFVLARHTSPSVINGLNISARAFKRILPVLILLSSALAFSVVWKAESVAGREAYCIQVADGGQSYKPAQSKLDLSYLTMGYSGASSQYHALLIIDDGGPVVQILNWSYRKGDFDTEAFEGYSVETGIENRPPIVCRLKRGFARELPILFP